MQMPLNASHTMYSRWFVLGFLLMLLQGTSPWRWSNKGDYYCQGPSSCLPFIAVCVRPVGTGLGSALGGLGEWWGGRLLPLPHWCRLCICAQRWKSPLLFCINIYCKKTLYLKVYWQNHIVGIWLAISSNKTPAWVCFLLIGDGQTSHFPQNNKGNSQEQPKSLFRLTTVKGFYYTAHSNSATVSKSGVAKYVFVAGGPWNMCKSTAFVWSSHPPQKTKKRTNKQTNQQTMNTPAYPNSVANHVWLMYAAQDHVCLMFFLRPQI